MRLRSFWHPRVPSPRQLLGAIAGVYAGALLLLFAWLRWLPVELAPLSLIAAFLPLLFLPLLFVLPLLWTASRPWSLTLQCLALCLYLLAYGRRFIPPSWRTEPVQPQETAITFMTYNLHYMVHPPEVLAEAILAQEADVVALEEVVPDSAAVLTQRLSWRYPYHAVCAEQSDVALFSRYPIRSATWHDLAGKQGAALVADVVVPGDIWRVVAMRPSSPQQIRFLGADQTLGVSYRNLDADLAALLDDSLIEGRPLVLLGDMNASEQSLAYRAAHARLQDSYLEAGWGLGLTFPQGGSMYTYRLPWPLVRIDYVFHTADLRAVSAQVVCNGVSDHCLLLARLAATQ